MICTTHQGRRARADVDAGLTVHGGARQRVMGCDQSDHQKPGHGFQAANVLPRSEVHTVSPMEIWDSPYTCGQVQGAVSEESGADLSCADRTNDEAIRECDVCDAVSLVLQTGRIDVERA